MQKALILNHIIQNLAERGDGRFYLQASAHWSALTDSSARDRVYFGTRAPQAWLMPWQFDTESLNGVFCRLAPMTLTKIKNMTA